MSLDLPKNIYFEWFWARSNSFSFGDLTKKILITKITKVFTSTERSLSMATFKLKTQMWDIFKNNAETLSQRNKLFLQRKQVSCKAENRIQFKAISKTP